MVDDGETGSGNEPRKPGRPRRFPTEAEIEKATAGCRNFQTYVVATGLAGVPRMTAFRWRDSAIRARTEIDEGRDPDPDDEKCLAFWESCAAAMDACRGEIESGFGEGAAGRRKVNFAQMMNADKWLGKRGGTEWRDRAEIGGIDAVNDGAPLRHEHMLDEDARAALVSMREHYESLKNPK